MESPEKSPTNSTANSAIADHTRAWILRKGGGEDSGTGPAASAQAGPSGRASGVARPRGRPAHLSSSALRSAPGRSASRATFSLS